MRLESLFRKLASTCSDGFLELKRYEIEAWHQITGTREGVGDPAKKGDRILYNLKMFLHRGEEVPSNERQAEHQPVR